MKIPAIILSFVLVLVQAYSQDYLIDFTGTGDTTGVGTVKADNLTSGASVTLDGNDTLHLVHITGTGDIIPEVPRIRIDPNPSGGSATLTFCTDHPGEATITLTDVSGKPAKVTGTFVPAGKHSFLITCISRGTYFVKISGNDFSYSAKLISNGIGAGNPEIIFIGSVKNNSLSNLKGTSGIIDMPYTDGDVLLFTGTAGQYSSIVTDIPAGNKTIAIPYYLCKDGGGNTYATVQIGSEKKEVQVWMAENLNTGVRIDGVLDQADNGIIEKYCSADLETNCDVYGGLYQWDELMQYVNTPGAQGICPAGWHVPTEEEWCTVTQYLDPTVDCGIIGMIGTDIGGKMKETGTMHWNAPNTGATNISGVTILPGGYRSSGGGTFGQLHLGGDFWQSTESSATQVKDWYFYYNNSKVSRTLNSKTDGYSLRCIKD